MVRARKKKVPKIKFELSRSGILGIVIVIFCVFLWMFLLGLWAGRNVLPQDQEKNLFMEEAVSIEKKLTITDESPKKNIPRLNNGAKQKIIISQ